LETIAIHLYLHHKFQIGSEFNIPHGIANAMLLCNTIRYNATNMPTKMTAFSQYDRPNSLRRYGEVALFLGFNQVHTEDRVEALLKWLEELKTVLEIPPSIQAWGIKEDDFMKKIDKLAVMAFDDQCTSANPRYPLISELKAILVDSYYGRNYQESYDRLIPVGSSMASLVAARSIPDELKPPDSVNMAVSWHLSAYSKSSLSSTSSHDRPEPKDEPQIE
jgi:acetaldehyde dehydrogenase/alcohol dehydrogenase